MAKKDATDEANRQKALVDTPDQQVTLKRDVKWGSTTYPADAVIMPDRDFKKYLVKHNLIKEGEKQPDVRTRSNTNFVHKR